ncbi:MAG: hypothetical protein MRECE_28c003 [Mycoplasmataceae bacterium CE_OT135]|nr:MAG: hypothetical protein MRECE_28c003 [Mycoplasmataceae bacterium CE_OT135]
MSSLVSQANSLLDEGVGVLFHCDWEFALFLVNLVSTLKEILLGLFTLFWKVERVLTELVAGCSFLSSNSELFSFEIISRLLVFSLLSVVEELL